MASKETDCGELSGTYVVVVERLSGRDEYRLA
jgi:hypothetical protein